MKFFINPFLLFFSVFVFSFLLYELNLSFLYHSIESSELQVLMFVFLVISVFFGVGYNLLFINKCKGEVALDISKDNAKLIMLIIIIGASLEFLFAHQIPLLTVLRGMGYEYKDFGIPTFHVFLVVYIMTVSTLSFNRFIQFGRKYNLIITLICLAYSISIVNRGMMLMLLSPCVYLYLFYKGSKKSIIYTLLFLMIVILTFGYIGDKRMKASGYTDENPIYRIGQIDSDTLKFLPSGFSWFYIYSSSPMANLLNQPDKNGSGKGDAIDYLATTIVPDFISKRIYENKNPLFNTILIDPQLTVSTGFGPAFRIFGYIGVIFTFTYLCFLIFTFSILNYKKNIIPTLSILCSISALMVFSNMLNFSAAVLPLIFITVFSKVKFRFKDFSFFII